MVLAGEVAVPIDPVQPTVSGGRSNSDAALVLVVLLGVVILALSGKKHGMAAPAPDQDEQQ